MSIKALILKRLPEPIQQFVRKAYYLQLLKSFQKTPELDFLGHLLKKGDAAVDVGANIGVYTKCLSEAVGSLGHVFSIEPIPSTFDLLSFNIQKLDLSNVTLFKCAISDFDGEVKMSIPVYSTGGDNFYEAGILNKSFDNKKIVKVKSLSLDSLLKDFNLKVSFIKIDVEGHELKVINGALVTIKNSMPAMLIEITNDPEDKDSDAAELFNLLRELGYHIFLLDGAQLKKYYPGAKSTNYFFLPNI